MNNSAVLMCQDLTKTFIDGMLHVPVLKKINLTIQAGERVAIVGASGSGKSTLLHLLGGLDKATSGKVLINDKETTRLTEAERSHLRNQYLGFIYQFHHLLPEFTVLENVCIPLLIRGVKPQQAINKAEILLAKVGLENRKKHKVTELSGGEKQRTAIVRALITEPLCILADEPTGNLDRQTAERVYEILLSLNHALVTSLVIVTHDQHLAQRMDRILTIQDGLLVPL